MAKDNIAGISTKLYGLLKPLDSQLRKRAIRAALTMLGDEDADLGSDNTSKGHEDRGDGGNGGGRTGFPPRAKSWMNAEKIAADELGHVFDLEHETEIIASRVPGKNTKDRTINAYLLAGISQLLQTGSMKFDDAAGRAAAKNLGCFNLGNHAKYMSQKGNVLSGSKDIGWSLTAPGLKAAAVVIKELAQE
jgi:hypothetical protein